MSLIILINREWQTLAEVQSHMTQAIIREVDALTSPLRHFFKNMSRKLDKLKDIVQHESKRIR